MTGLDATERALLDRAAQLDARIRSCWLRVPCPTCEAPVGMQCRRKGTRHGPVLKHPHEQRWTQEVPRR